MLKKAGAMVSIQPPQKSYLYTKRTYTLIMPYRQRILEVEVIPKLNYPRSVAERIYVSDRMGPRFELVRTG
jgi:hypothetical protein